MDDETTPALVSYRFYWTNGAGRIVSAAEAIEAVDDVDAVEQAKWRVATKGRPAEVWLGSRCIIALEAQPRD